MQLNNNFRSLPTSYVFEELAKMRVSTEKKRGEKLIDLGIGDIKLPLFGCVSEAMKEAAEKLSLKDGFIGYPPATGFDFLKDAIIADYAERGVKLSRDEIFINDGAKTELFAFNSLIKQGSRILLPVPCYPAFAEAAAVCGNELIFARPDEKMRNYPPYGTPCDVIYLCSPQNPSGITLSASELSAWTDYALSQNAVILFDGAYSDYISDDSPRSVFEIPRAKECAVEVRSFSKGYGFTGLRLGYSVIPDEQKELNSLKKRLCGLETNGVSYITQRGGLACLTSEGKAEMKKRVKYYKDNAAILKSALRYANLSYTDGNNSPYVFVKCPKGFTDGEFCSYLAEKRGIIATPGSGFYLKNEQYFRMAAFSPRQTIFEAAKRLSELNFTS